MATIFERVKTIVVNKLGVAEEQVTEEADWVQLKADPSELEDLFTAFEEEFSTEGNPVEISEEEAENIHTIGDVIAYLKDHGVKEGVAA